MSNASPQAAVLTKLGGQVYAERQGTRVSLAEGDAILSTDTVITDSTGEAEVRFMDGSTASLSPNTSLEIRNFAFGEGVEPSFILNLAQGTMRSLSGEVVKQNPDAFKIITPQATVGIRGTELFTAVQPDGKEVHAVLHIGKDHIVVVTGNDGQSVVMDQALQAVNMQGGDASGMLKQTFKLTEMQQIIKAIAPSQVQKPIQPGGPDGPDNPNGPQGSEAAPDAVHQGQDGTPQQAAPVSASQSSVVAITYDAEAQSSLQTASSSVDVNTLIQVVENLQGALADAGFTVQVGDGVFGDAVAGLDGLGTSSSVLGDALLDNGTFIQTPTPPPVVDAPAGPTAPAGPAAPVDPGPPTAQVYLIDGNYSGNWQADHGAGMDPSLPQHITITGVLGNYLNVNGTLQTGHTVSTSDRIIVGKTNGGHIWGDGDIIAKNGETIIAGSDYIKVIAPGAGSVTGDSANITAETGSTIIFGNDTIETGASASTVTIYGDSSANLAGTSGVHVVLGNDTITVGSMEQFSKIFGDMAKYGSGNTFEGGHDTITVGSMKGSSGIEAGKGNDTVYVTTMETKGSVLGGEGDDTISIGTLTKGTVDGGVGNDTITVNSMAGGTVKAGTGQDTLIIKGMTGGVIDLTGEARTFTILGSTFDGTTLFAKFSGGTTLTLNVSGLSLEGVNHTSTATDVMEKLLNTDIVRMTP